MPAARSVARSIGGVGATSSRVSNVAMSAVNDSNLASNASGSCQSHSSNGFSTAFLPRLFGLAGRSAGGLLNSDGDLRVAVKGHQVERARLARDGELREAAQQPGQRELDLQPAQRRAEAVVRPHRK